VINTNLAPMSHSFRDSVRWDQNRYIQLPLLCLTSQTEGFPWDDLCKIFTERSYMAKVSNGMKTLPKIFIARVGWQTTDDLSLRSVS